MQSRPVFAAVAAGILIALFAAGATGAEQNPKDGQKGERGTQTRSGTRAGASSGGTASGSSLDKATELVGAESKRRHDEARKVIDNLK